MYRLLVLLLVWNGVATAAEPVSWRSPERQVPVLELFTSHGCSSCPPADRWLRGFSDRPGLWQEVVPIAFHVDYWDRLGWPDRFADARYSERQYRYRQVGHSSGVYTPGFVVAGREWRGWFNGGQPPLEPGPKVGRLHLSATVAGPVELLFEPVGNAGDYRAHLAVLGFGITSSIGGGENSGRELEEDFVLLGLREGGLVAAGPGRWKQTLILPETVPVETRRRALVAWVSRGDDPAPLQAVGGWLNE